MKKNVCNCGFAGSVGIAFLLLSAIAGSAQERSEKTTYKVEESISYRDASHVDAYQREKCLLDVYYPTNLRDAPVVVWFHCHPP